MCANFAFIRIVGRFHAGYYAGLERSYMLEGSAGEHRVEVIIALLEKMLPPRTGVLHY